MANPARFAGSLETEQPELEPERTVFPSARLPWRQLQHSGSSTIPGVGRAPKVGTGFVAGMSDPPAEALARELTIAAVTERQKNSQAPVPGAIVAAGSDAVAAGSGAVAGR